MSTKERIFHAVLFEVIALIFITVVDVAVTGEAIVKVSALAVSLSAMAVVWNYFYNLGFDRHFGSERILRTKLIRFWHGVCFEGGMIIFSLPVITLWLDMGFLTALLMYVGATILFLL